MATHKILFVLPSLEGGGAERVAVVTLRHLAVDRFEPVLATFFKGDAYAKELPEGVRRVHLPTKGRMRFPRLVRALARLLDQEQPALVVSYLNYPNLLCLLAAKLARHRCPVIVTEHNSMGHTHSGNFSRFLRGVLSRILLRRAAAVVAVSDGVRSQLVADYGVKPERCLTIHNPVELTRVRSLACEPVEADLVDPAKDHIVAVGRLFPQKNFALLLQGFAEVVKAHACRLLLLGDGPERQSLERLATQLGVADRVRFLGFQINPFKFVARAKVFALTSDWEGFGNVIIEAMACGVPVVSSDCDHGPREIIRDGENGLLFPPGDRHALTGCLTRLLGDAGLRSRLADAGRQAVAQYDAPVIARRYEELFQAVIEAKG